MNGVAKGAKEAVTPTGKRPRADIREGLSVLRRGFKVVFGLVRLIFRERKIGGSTWCP